jgi:hypothetical protein
MRRGWRRLDAGFAAHEQWPQRQAQRQPGPHRHAVGCADLEHVSGTHGNAYKRRNGNTARHCDSRPDRHANGHARAHGDAGANAVTHARADADTNAGADADANARPEREPVRNHHSRRRRIRQRLDRRSIFFDERAKHAQQCR